MSLPLQGFHRLRLLDLFAALLAGPAHIIVPEIEHRFTEMLDDVLAVEMDVFYQCSAIFAVEDYVLFFSRRAAALDYDADCVWRALWRVRHVRRNKECLALVYDVINDAIVLADAHLDVALELVKVLFRIDHVKIISRIWPFDDHHEKITAIVQITVAHRRFELVGVLINPVFQINWRLHSGHKARVFASV
jgi:hypothetical protein